MGSDLASASEGADGRGSARRGRVYRQLLAEVDAAGLAIPVPGQVVTDAEVAQLPETVQRYLRFMGVVGRPRVGSFLVASAGRFRRRPGDGWLRATSWQYNTAAEVARIFVIRVWMAGVLPIWASDTYLAGCGRMHVTTLGRTVADGAGVEYDISELVTWVNDAIALAPSLLLTPAATWAAADQNSFDLTLAHAGHTVTARVFIDERGAPVDVAADRYAVLPGGTRLARWRTPVQRWDTTEDRPFPGPFSVIYDLVEGPFCYLEGSFLQATLRYNVPPDGVAP